MTPPRGRARPRAHAAARQRARGAACQRARAAACQRAPATAISHARASLRLPSRLLPRATLHSVPRASNSTDLCAQPHTPVLILAHARVTARACAYPRLRVIHGTTTTPAYPTFLRQHLRKKRSRSPPQDSVKALPRFLPRIPGHATHGCSSHCYK